MILALLVGVAVTGCKPSSENKDATSSKQIDQQIDQAKANVDQASDELGAYTHLQRQAFITKMEALSADLTRQLDELSENAAKLITANRAKAQPRIADLKAKRAVIDQQLAAIKKADAYTWEQTKAATAQAYEDLKAGITDMRQWLSESIAPKLDSNP